MCREQVQDSSNQLRNSDNWRSRGRTDCRQCVYVQLHEQEICSGKLEFRKMHEKPDTDMTELVHEDYFHRLIITIMAHSIGKLLHVYIIILTIIFFPSD